MLAPGSDYDDDMAILNISWSNLILKKKNLLRGVSLQFVVEDFSASHSLVFYFLTLFLSTYCPLR